MHVDMRGLYTSDDRGQLRPSTFAVYRVPLAASRKLKECRRGNSCVQDIILDFELSSSGRRGGGGSA
eukprot:5141805-Pyramimonas_sp.AAC.1